MSVKLNWNKARESGNQAIDTGVTEIKKLAPAGAATAATVITAASNLSATSGGSGTLGRAVAGLGTAASTLANTQSGQSSMRTVSEKTSDAAGVISKGGLNSTTTVSEKCWKISC